LSLSGLNPSPLDDDCPERDLINSPRLAAISQVVPWKEDHLLPPMKVAIGKKCLVLDLDETLVHSSFKAMECDYVIPIELEGQVFKIYVSKRPHVDEFMKVCGRLFEVVVFTASLATYADAVLDLLDIHKVVDWRLFRESCSPVTGTFVKDLGRMGRPIEEIIIIDNSPHSYAFNPHNAIPIQSWFNDPTDTELLTLIPILERLAAPSVRDVKEELQSLLEVSGVDVLSSTFSGVSIQGDDQDQDNTTDPDEYHHPHQGEGDGRLEENDGGCQDEYGGYYDNLGGEETRVEQTLARQEEDGFHQCGSTYSD